MKSKSDKLEISLLGQAAGIRQLALRAALLLLLLVTELFALRNSSLTFAPLPVLLAVTCAVAILEAGAFYKKVLGACSFGCF
ncbi:hypothetical protein [Lactobacillus nasalidis]|uniref:hypothetical protein n=1 Tax=Lactobacillus nasalidis TaxID=2797258 RepID=UPI001916B2BB|nr:hypothetical protein [Lactobacillus nasalidis]GHV97254.1 hypothetical protein lacNasYZ01_04360 [Lactobacillus nasalidis]GHV99028.1 hypothetical protein lacNasYZ02_04580 [Lactobacillus nasalidis]